MTQPACDLYKKASHITISILLLLLSCASPATKNTSNKLAEEKLKGKVKTVLEFWFDAKEIDGVPTSGALGSKTLEKYDEHGNLVGEIEYDNRTTRKVIDSFVYTNNIAGKPLKTMRYNGDGTLYATYLYTYNKNGLLKEDMRFTEDGQKHTQNIYKYDKQNLMEHRKLTFRIYKDSIREEITRYLYNSKGQKIEKKTYANDRLTYYSTFYKYDSKGNVIEEYGKRFDGRDYKEQTDYDKDGNEIEQWSSWGDKKYHSKSSYEQLDEHGNWQNRLLYSEDILNQIAHREFTYY